MLRYFYLLPLMILFFSCDNSESPIPLVNTAALEPVAFDTLTSTPCLETWQMQLVVRDSTDYENVRRKYAPQGDFVSFVADGNQSTFTPPYKPVGTGSGNTITPDDMSIYIGEYDANTIYQTIIDGERVGVPSYPFTIESNQVPIVDTLPPFSIINRIFYYKIFKIDSLTGAVTFTTPPPLNSRVSFYAPKVIFKERFGGNCNIENFDFENFMMIGKSIHGNGCLKGMAVNLYVDHERKQLIHLTHYMVDFNGQRNGCTEQILTFTKWIKCNQIPADYSVVFKEDTVYVNNTALGIRIN